MNRIVPFVLSVILLVSAARSQTYKGPRSGSVPSGVIVSTNSFMPAARDQYPGPLFHAPRNKEPLPLVPPPVTAMAPSAPAGSNLTIDHVAQTTTLSFPPVPIVSVAGIPDAGTSIPPDPYVAAGPNHVIATVNSQFRIIDKAGNVVKNILADSWYGSPKGGAFDPKIIYDHYAQRWVMVWLQQSNADSTSHFLLSVSDDSDPTGTWYNWALPANVLGDSVVGSWSDYEGLGYDSSAIYLTNNQWTFAGSFQYTRLRVIPKAQLYNNTAGPVIWADFWDLRDASGFTVPTVRPTLMFTPADGYLLAGMPSFLSGSYFAVFVVLDPVGSPNITVSNIPVTAWTSPTNANQLGGSTILLEAGSERVRFEPVYRDSSLWIVHSIASGTGNQYSSVRYVRINVFTNTLLEDRALGADGFWYYYPGLVVDKDKNIAITYSRSGTTEHPGAFMTWRLAGDPPGLRPSVTIRPGETNYVKDYGSGRNRWGDYNGIAIDPSDQNNFWLFTEYAASPANTYGTWFFNMRLVPYPNQKAWATRTSVSYGLREIGTSSDTTHITLYNQGANPLNVSNISTSQSSYHLLGLPTLPLAINTFDSLAFTVYFLPAAHGMVNDSIVVASDDPLTPLLKIPLTGKGVLISRAVPGILYATTLSSTGSGQLYHLDPTSGGSTTVGPLGVSEIQGLAIRQSTKEVYGTLSTPSSTTLYRMSVGYGDAYFKQTIPLGNLRAIAFTLTGDTLYGATTSGKLYRINPDTGDTTFIGATTGIAYSSLAFNPVTGKLWASVRPALAGKDKIYRVDVTTGNATLVGATGFGVTTSGITFDMQGRLYGTTGVGTSVNNLISIDTSTASGTVIGSTGLTGLDAIILRTDSLSTSVESRPEPSVPAAYVLEQNYPNPFNPVTQIRYGLPRESSITLTVYNLVGQKVATLFEGSQSAGFHEVTWDGRNQAGQFVASSVYIYRLEAHATDGNPAQLFTDTKKMLLLK